MTSVMMRDYDDSSSEKTTKRRRTEENNNLDQRVSISNRNTNSEGILAYDSGKKCGILEWITVKNFMCHDHLTFEFSPNINFVQGRNGSGKSAILTAVVIGLGGGARFTNRGSNIRELVKHGKQVASIEIALRNCGNYPFKHEVYGDSILVERRIISSGGGGYKIKTARGEVISVKKEDLTRILEHFNLQVDNPVTILNQDMSRSFLNTMDPKLLFKFFLKATQLQQIQDNYALLQNSINRLLVVIQSRKETLPDIRREVEEHKARYELSASIREKKKQLQELRHELVWANIIHKEKQKEIAEEHLDKLKQAISKLNENISEIQQKIDRGKELLLQATEKFNKASGHLRASVEKVKEMEKIIRDMKEDYKNKQSSYNVAEKRIRGITSEILALKKAIEKNDDSKQKNWLEKRAAWKKELESYMDSVKETDDNLKTEVNHHENLKNTKEKLNNDERQLTFEEKNLQKQLVESEKELNMLKNQKGSQLSVYGQWVPHLLQKIENAYSKNMFIKKPVGPLGAFIEVKDKKWAHVAEAVFGPRITSFCVDNRNDERVLSNLMQGLNFNQRGRPSVTVAKFRDHVHDVSRFETRSSDYFSLWSVLSVSNTVVANTIIDQMQVESILLIPTAKEAGQKLKDRATVPKNCKCAYTLNMDLYYPDPNYRLYSGKGTYRAKFLQVSVEDRILDLKTNQIAIQKQREEVLKKVQDHRSRMKAINQELSASKQKVTGLKNKLGTIHMMITELRNQDMQPPPDISQLEEDIKQQEEHLQTANVEMEQQRQAMAESKEKFNQMTAQIKELKEDEDRAYEEVCKCKKEIDNCNSDKAASSLNMLKKKKEDLSLKEADQQKLVEEKAASLEASLKSLEGADIGSRINTKRSVEELERQFASLQERLNKQREETGDPIIIAENYRASKIRYKEIYMDLEKHENLLKKLRESLVNREEKCQRFYKWLGIIVKTFFRQHLAARKLSGSLSINFDEEKLTISVEKPDNNTSFSPQAEGKVSKAQALRKLAMMSGGERSFSTVSFIIALWNAIDSPFRMLDEYDVFMDMISRNRAMRMMISSAKPANQYIFLTPLNLDIISKLSNCTVFQMPNTGRDEEDD